jgi:hypothetical protein
MMTHVNPFGAWHYLALIITYLPETLPTFPNQDRSLRLIYYNLDEFSKSIYDYKQSFINYKDLYLTMIFCVIIYLLTL